MALVTFDQLNEFFEDTDEDIVQSYVEPFNDVMEFYEINNKQRIAMFLAQVGHESGGLRTIKENLNYSADRLKVIFPKYFKNVDPAAYAKNPEFYAFYRSIEAYKKSFKDKADVMVLDPNSDFLKYMRSSRKKKE